MVQLGHSRVDLLKVDIEGFEYRLVEGIFRGFLEKGWEYPLPMQILIEQHYLSNEGMRWGKGNNPGLSSGEMAILWINLSEMGYVLVGVLSLHLSHARTSLLEHFVFPHIISTQTLGCRFTGKIRGSAHTAQSSWPCGHFARK